MLLLVIKVLADLFEDDAAAKVRMLKKSSRAVVEARQRSRQADRKAGVLHILKLDTVVLCFGEIVWTRSLAVEEWCGLAADTTY